MTREEYLKQLVKHLGRLTQDEKNEAMEFYAEYLADAEDPALAMQKLGTPKELARSIMADRVIKDMDEKPEGGVRKGVSALWVVALATLSPIALVLALVVIVVVITVLITVVGFTLAMFALGAFVFWSSFFIMGADVISGIFFIGISLIFLGITAIMANVIWRAGGALLRGVARKMHNRKSRRAEI